MNLLRRIHPIFFALAPVLSLYATNAGQVAWQELVLPVAACAVFVIVMVAVLTLLLRSFDKAALLASLAALLCFSYGPVTDLFRNVSVASISLASPKFLFPVWLLLLLLAVFLLIRARASLAPLGRISAVVGTAMVAVPLLQLGLYKTRSAIDIRSAVCTDNAPIPLNGSTSGGSERRDIYYIILDRYPSSKTLRDAYGFENSEFVGFLENRGFYVAADAFSNYINTSQSLASSLNFDYINCLSRTMGPDSDNWMPLFTLMEDYRVWRFLKERGYRFIHFGTEWQPTSKNRFADLNYNLHALPEFTSLLLQKTVFYPVLTRLGPMDILRQKWERVDQNFDRLADIPAIEDPTFVFAHFLLPHDPFVFNADGSYSPPSVVAARSREENFLNQIRYANSRVTTLVEQLTSKSAVPPIIVVQGDEGPYPASVATVGKDWRTATREDLAEKVRILNALYLPGVDTSKLYPSMTPVNTFRMIFNLYFGTNYELLADECYAYINPQHLYSFFPITDSVR